LHLFIKFYLGVRAGHKVTPLELSTIVFLLFAKRKRQKKLPFLSLTQKCLNYDFFDCCDYTDFESC
jgi:hypothetical protein